MDAAASQKIKLHGYWRSGASWRLRIVLNLKACEYEYVPVNLLKGEHKSDTHAGLNPMKQVPVLELDGMFMTESLPICEYLEEACDGQKLLPEDKKDKFAVRRLCEIINANTQPIQNLPVLGKVAEIGGDKEEWARWVIERGLTGYEAQIQQTSGKYSFGDSVTLADAFLIPQVYNANRFKLDMSKFPKINAVVANLEQLEAFQKAHCDA